MFIKLRYSKIIILGAGPSGLTSSIYIFRSNKNPIVLAGKYCGGQLINTNMVDNWPGIISIKGKTLMQNFYDQIINFNIEIYFDEIYNVNFLNKPFFIFSKNSFYFCEFLNICTGSFYKLFNKKKQYIYLGKNVSTCANCDSYYYKNKKICVIGGGDASFENLKLLISFTKYITIINRNKIFKSNFNLIKNFFILIKNKIFFKFNFFLLEFIGDDFYLIYIKLKNFFDLKIIILKLDGLFIFIGSFSNSFFFPGQLRVLKNYILNRNNLTESSITNINYVHSCGDVKDFLYRQAITSSSSGCISYFEILSFYCKLF